MIKNCRLLVLQAFLVISCSTLFLNTNVAHAAFELQVPERKIKVINFDGTAIPEMAIFVDYGAYFKKSFFDFYRQRTIHTETSTLQSDGSQLVSSVRLSDTKFFTKGPVAYYQPILLYPCENNPDKKIVIAVGQYDYILKIEPDLGTSKTPRIGLAGSQYFLEFVRNVLENYSKDITLSVNLSHEHLESQRQFAYNPSHEIDCK
jgi:hypothetical protein